MFFTQHAPHNVESRSKYFLLIAVLYVAVLMISNTVAGKIVQLGAFSFSGAVILFPIAYVFNDILTEVYGYKESRRIVWAGILTQIIMSVFYWLVMSLPSAPFWTGQAAFETILGSTPRIVAASVLALFAGEFSNSYILSRMKVMMNGKKLWMRTIGSTIVGEAVDTLIFTFGAFWGVFSFSDVMVIVGTEYLVKVLYEVAITPVTCGVVGWLKKAEGIDVYDKGIDYNPFKLGAG